MQTVVRKSRQQWGRQLRGLAILMAVYIHLTAPTLYQWQSVSSMTWWSANIFNGFSRVGVPLFVMLSGAFILPKREPLVYFFTRRVRRVVLPWLFWLCVLFVYEQHVSLLSGFESFDGMQTFILSSHFRSTVVSIAWTGFWFMPRILSLYCVTPLLWPIVQAATQKQLLFWIGAWVAIATMWPFSWSMPLCLAYLGYYLAGYSLTREDFPKQKVVPAQVGALALATSIIITLATGANSQQQAQFSEHWYSYTSIFVIAASISFFYWFQHFFGKKPAEKQDSNLPQTFVGTFFSEAGDAAFGLYFTHILLLKATQYPEKITSFAPEFYWLVVGLSGIAIVFVGSQLAKIWKRVKERGLRSKVIIASSRAV